MITIIMTIRQSDLTRKKRAEIPVSTSAVQDLLNSILNAVNGLSEVANADGRALSANDDRVGFITALILLDVTFPASISVEDLTSVLMTAITNITGVSVQNFGLLNDACSIANPCLNGATCAVDTGSVVISCTCPTGYTGETCEVLVVVSDSANDDDRRTALVIALPIVAVLFLLLLVACGFMALAYNRHKWITRYNWEKAMMDGETHEMSGVYRKKTKRSRRRSSQPQHNGRFVHKDVSGPRRPRSRSVDDNHVRSMNTTFVHERDDQLEMSRIRKPSNARPMFSHDSEPHGPYYQRTMDGNGFSYGPPSTSGYNTKESYSNGAPKRYWQYNNSGVDQDIYF